MTHKVTDFLTRILLKTEACEGGHEYIQTDNVRVTVVPVVCLVPLKTTN